MPRLTEWVHLALRAHLRPGDWAVDATLGNGHDALCLADCVEPGGRVFGFDVQEDALAASRALLAGRSAFRAVRADHAELADHLPADARGRLRAVVFNLGFLPGGDHARTTESEGTTAALALALEWLAEDGVLSCVAYPGHPAGAREAEAVRTWFEARVAEGHRLTRLDCPGTRTPAPFALWLERVPGRARPARHGP